MRFLRCLVVLAAGCALVPRAQALEWVPIFKLDALGGQFFFEGDNTSFSGNGSLLFSPGVKLSEKDMLVPTFSSQYRRTREVRELIGGGFLTQEALDTLVMVKWVRQMGELWSVKPNVSFKNELITESKEETLGKGLFDYHKVSFGVEAERRSERLNLRPAITVYGVRFYRYHALSSSDPNLGAEIRSGDRTLDFNAYDFSLSADFLLREGTVLKGSLLSSYRPYLDQNTVQVNGTYKDEKRFDYYGVLIGGVQQVLPEWSLWRLSAENATGLNLGYTFQISNQDNYDASRTRFNGDYYDYGELAAGPFYAVRFNKKFAATVGYDYTRRGYRHRPVQKVDGTYDIGAGAVVLNTHTVSAQFLYPLHKNVTFKVQGSWRKADSNMKYEASYRYNYEAAHYLVGLGYSL